MVYLAGARTAVRAAGRPQASKHGVHAERRSAVLQERQILARLQHPAIARLLDGGVTPDGIPFFAMERVDVSVTEYCRERRLGIRNVLGIFLEICDAVQYAHRNLVVHRDLKPSNILVDAAGRVKLLDFGIAKLLAEEASGDTAEATRTLLRALTPEYAAPEQILDEPVTTATDVYSLGVVLYELLTGARPYPAASVALVSSSFTRARSARPTRAESSSARASSAATSTDRAEGSPEGVRTALPRRRRGRGRAPPSPGLPVPSGGDTLRYRSSILRRHRLSGPRRARLLTYWAASGNHWRRVARRARAPRPMR